MEQQNNKDYKFSKLFVLETNVKTSTELISRPVLTYVNVLEIFRIKISKITPVKIKRCILVFEIYTLPDDGLRKAWTF